MPHIVSWDNVTGAGESITASHPSLGLGAGCYLWCLHSLVCLLSSHGLPSSCALLLMWPLSSLHLVKLLGSKKQKWKPQGCLRNRLKNPITSFWLYSIGQNEPQGQLDQRKIYPEKRHIHRAKERGTQGGVIYWESFEIIHHCYIKWPFQEEHLN